jgi:hypothetical protein
LKPKAIEQRLAELPALKVAHLAERRLVDEFPDAAAQLGVLHAIRCSA